MDTTQIAAELNKLPKPSSMASLYLLAQQAFENGYRAMTVNELVTYLSANLPEELTRSEFIYEKFAPGSALPDPGREASLFLGAGTYTVPGSGSSLVLTENFNVVGWDGEEWVKVLEVPVEGTNIESIADEAGVGKNLLDKSKIVGGSRYAPAEKKILPDANYRRTGYIPVEEGKTYTRSGGVAGTGGFAQLGDINAVTSFSGNTFTIPVGSGINYVLFNTTLEGNAGNDNIVQLEEGASPTTYEPFISGWIVRKDALPNDVVYSQQLNDQYDTIVETIVVTGKNLLDKSKIVGDSEYSSTLKKIIGQVNYRRTGYIPVQEGKTYTRTAGISPTGGFAQEGDIDALMNFEGDTFTIPVGSGVNYVVFNTTTTGNVSRDNIAQFEEGSSATAYEPYTYEEQLKIRESLLPEMAPDEEGGVDSIELAIEREKINSNTDEINRLKAETESTINSLLKLEGVDSGEITVSIPPLNVGVQNYVMKVGLHYKAPRGTPLFDDIFFNEQCRKDFSDIRFEDENGNLLDFNIHTTGNYDVVKDNRLGESNLGLSTGEIVASQERGGLRISSDNATTWRTLNANMSLVFVDSNDNIYGNSWTEGKVYRFSPVDSYTTPLMVLDLTSPPSAITAPGNCAEDDDGNLYFGKYQDAWDAEVFKSIDGGLSFTSVYQSNESQHVHTISLDRTKTPNVVYVGFDGIRGSNRPPKCIKSVDGGATWSTLPIPFGNSDFGVQYCGDSFRLCGGENIVLGGPTIYKTTDDINFYPVLQTFQRTRSIVKFGDMLICGGCAGGNNRVGQLYASYDDGETWETIFAENWIGTDSIGAGLRNFSNIFTPTGETESQILIHGKNEWIAQYEYRPLRFYLGGDNYYALAYVNVGALPMTGRAIKAKWGYPVKYPKREIYKDFSDNANLTFRLKMDEGRGDFLKEVVSDNFINAKESIQWIGEKTQRYGHVYPFNLLERSDAVKFLKGVKVSDINVLPNKNFTVCFWANANGKLTQNNSLLFGNPAGVHIYVNDFRIYVADGNGNRAIYPMFWASGIGGTDMWVFNAITVSNATIPVLTIQEGDKNIPFTDPLTAWAPAAGSGGTHIGGATGFSVLPFSISDFRVFNRALSAAELREIYFGSQYLTMSR